jgi:type IV secretion system protein TrbF
VSAFDVLRGTLQPRARGPLPEGVNPSPEKPADKISTPSPVHLAARREWNEQVGTMASDRTFARYTALGCLALAGYLGYAYVQEKNQVKTVLYAVETGKLGDALSVKRIDPSPPMDPIRIKAQLADWIVAMRTVWTDRAAQTTLVRKAYDWVDKSSAANRELLDWYEQTPFDRAKDVTVAVAVRSVLPVSGNTWRAEWEEDIREAKGGKKVSSHIWQASISFIVVPPVEEAAIYANPNGLYIQNFSWAVQQ